LQGGTEFIRSRQVSPIAPVETFLDQVRERGDYADDVTPEELAASEAAYQDYLDVILSSKELKAELFGELERMGLHCPETSSSLLETATEDQGSELKPWML